MGQSDRKPDEDDWLVLDGASSGDGGLGQEEYTGEVVYPAESEDGVTPNPSTAVLEAELQETRNRLLRNAADYDNYRKRLHRDQRDAVRFANEQFFRDLLPILDSLHRAVRVPLDRASVEGLHEGMAMVLGQIEALLMQYGVTPILSEAGVPFDPVYHEALQRVEDDEVPPGCIAQELQTGYLYHQRLLRPARVLVAMAEPSLSSFAAGAVQDNDDDYEDDSFEDEDTLPEAPVLHDGDEPEE